MTQSRRLLQIAIATVVLLSFTVLTQADLIPLKNSDFSEDIFYAPGNNTQNWVANDPAVIWSPPNRVEFTIEHTMLAGTVLTLEQRVTLEPGTYTLSFDYGFRSFISDESDYFTVFAVGGNPEAKEVASNHGVVVDEETSYVVSGPESLTFASTGGSVLLKFQLDRRGDSLAVDTVATIENVELSVVPVPGAALLGGIGLGYASWRLRRRNRAKA